MSHRKGYHVTTPRKIERYNESGGVILPPVRFWQSRESAELWARKVSRSVIVELDWPDTAYPLPDHGPRSAWWTPNIVRQWRATAVGGDQP